MKTRKPKTKAAKQKYRRNLIHGTHTLHATPMVEEITASITIKPLIHRFKCSTDINHWRILRYLGVFQEDRGYKPSADAYQKRFVKWLKDGGNLQLFAVADEDGIKAPSYLDYCPLEETTTQYLTDLNRKLIQAGSKEVKVSSVEYGIDLFTKYPQGLFQLLMNNLRFLNPKDNVPINEKEGRNKTFKFGNLSVYMRGSGSAGKNGWLTEECDRVRIEFRANRAKNIRLETETLEQFLSESPFMAAFMYRGTRRLRFEASKIIPSKEHLLAKPGMPWKNQSLLQTLEEVKEINPSADLEAYKPMQNLEDKIYQSLKDAEENWKSLYNNTYPSKINLTNKQQTKPLEQSQTQVNNRSKALEVPEQSHAKKKEEGRPQELNLKELLKAFYQSEKHSKWKLIISPLLRQVYQEGYYGDQGISIHKLLIFIYVLKAKEINPKHLLFLLEQEQVRDYLNFNAFIEAEEVLETIIDLIAFLKETKLKDKVFRIMNEKLGKRIGSVHLQALNAPLPL